MALSSTLSLVIFAMLLMFVSSIRAQDMYALVSQYDHCHAYDAGTALKPYPNGVIFWTIDRSNNQVNFAITCTGPNTQSDGPGYCALGFKSDASNDAKMVSTDVNMGVNNNGAYTVYDIYNDDYRACSSGKGVCQDTAKSPAGTNNVINPVGYRNGTGCATSVTFQWSRPLAASDQWDAAIQDKTVSILMSVKGYSSQVFAYHNDFFSADDQINFFSAPSCPKNCNGQGTCNKGCCICRSGFSGYDCSISGANPCSASTTASTATTASSTSRTSSATTATTGSAPVTVSVGTTSTSTSSTSASASLTLSLIAFYFFASLAILLHF